jgi:hypothetical protein
VRLAGLYATSVTLVSSTQLRARTPAVSTAGPTWVQVINTNDESRTLSNGFNYTSTSSSSLTSTSLTSGTAEESAMAVTDAPLSATAELSARQESEGEAADADGDGLPTEWEQRYGLAADSSDGENGADGDPDGDGVPNAQEQREGTHPRGLFRRYLASGATGPDAKTRLAIANPGGEAALVVSFVDEAGGLVRVPAAVPAGSRISLDPGAAGLAEGASFSIALESDQPVALDRLTASGAGETRLETAVEAPAMRWYLPRSTTGGGSTLTYEVANAEDRPAEVQVRYLPHDEAAAVTRRYTIQAHGRVVIDVSQEDASLARAEVAAEIESVNDAAIVVAAHAAANGYVESTNGVPVVEAFAASGTVEAGVDGGARIPAAPETAGRWLVAEAEQGGAGRAATSLVVSNAAPAPVRVAVTLLGEGGAGQTATFEVGAQDQLTLPLAAVFPRAEGRFAVLVQAEDAATASGIVVERKTLWRGRGGRVTGAGGVATSLP